MSLPGRVDQSTARPLLPPGTAGAAEREQERSRRRRPRGYTFSMFHSPGGADHMDARGHVQSSQPPPWTPIVPIHNVCPLPGEGRPWCPEQEAPAGTTGRPSSSPRGARKRSPATLGERPSRCLLGAEAAPKWPRFPVTCSGLRRRVSCGSGCIYSRGARRPYYSLRAQKWKGWCPCGGAVFRGCETRIHLCEDHKAHRLVAAVARLTRWPDRLLGIFLSMCTVM